MTADSSNKNTETEPHEGDQSTPASAGRILLAEDDTQMRSMLAWALRAEGYTVTECADGLTAFEKLLATAGPDAQADRERFQLVVSDVRMPGMTALEILQALPPTAKLPPVILITAFGDWETHHEAHRLGAAIILNKPFEIETLIANVRELAVAGPGRGNEQGPHTESD